MRSRSLADYTIDMHESEFSEATVIQIRNALAYGLVSGTRFPLTLLHKGQQTKMTVEWFGDQQTLVRKQEERISACGRERWPQSPWWGRLDDD